MKTIFEPRNLRAILGQSAKVEVMNMLANRPETKILVDGGDPDETRNVKALLGFVQRLPNPYH